jgi:hypothetical protein
MDADAVMRLIERAIVSLGLDRPLRPWWLGEAKPPRPVVREPVLAASCPLPYDLDPDLLLDAFAAQDRPSISEQIEDAYRSLVVLPWNDGGDEAEVVRVQLGLPLIGRDRALLRIRTSNRYGKDAQLVTGEHHAWLTLEGEIAKETNPAQKKLESVWEPWIVGRSPGLRAAVDLNRAPESAFLRLPSMNETKARAIIAARPFASIDQLAAVKDIGPAGLALLRELVTIKFPVRGAAMKSTVRDVAFVLGAMSFVFACSSTETADTVHDCTLRDGGCGEGCCPQPGDRYDPTRDCVEREQVIGCAPGPASTSECKMSGIVLCFVSPEGTFRTPGLVQNWTGPTGPSACSEAVATKVSAAKACATSDAGSD